jgi:hypothetical protein
MFDVEQKATSTVDAMAWKEIGVSSWVFGIESIRFDILEH